jgi:hypothetical protein
MEALDKAITVLAVLDEGQPQAEAVTAVSGKPVKTIPTAWRAILNQEEGRRQALAEIAQSESPASVEPFSANEQPHQCKCPKCGWAFTPE